MLASVLLAAIGLYLLSGAVFACAFQAHGLRVVDPSSSAGATPLFRLLISPGVIALWPVLLLRWRAARTRRGDSMSHPGAHA